MCLEVAQVEVEVFSVLGQDEGDFTLKLENLIYVECRGFFEDPLYTNQSLGKGNVDRKCLGNLMVHF